MLNILINAYAVAPNWGSEQGMGWNWIINIAKHCKCYVITEGEWQKEIEEALLELPQKENIKLYYNPVSEKVRKMCWNQGDWRFYYYYHKWQKKTLAIAQQICKEEKIDITHQLNMIGFREPGLLWKIKGIPHVWGPIGGMENIPTSFLKDINWKYRTFLTLKNMINQLQYKYKQNVRKAIKHSDILVAAVSGVKTIIEKEYNKPVILINETGCKIDTNNETSIKKEKKDDNTLNIIWVGKFDFRKQLELALSAIAKVKHINVKLHICGTGNEQQINYYSQMCKTLDITDKCIWHGQTKHDVVLKLMKECDALLFTSISEGTPHVVLEAISNDLPVICHDVCGQGDIVTDETGFKIELSTAKESSAKFGKILENIYNNRNIVKDKSNNCQKRKLELSWEVKTQQMIEIYNKLITK